MRIARELPDIPAEPPRLYVVTGGAQTVLADDPVNLEQAGLRGLMRVIGNEHPELRPTQIDSTSTPMSSGWHASCCSGPTRTRPPGATASGTRRA